MKRYKYYNTLEFRNLVEHHDGDYVLYSDHKQTVDELVGALEGALNMMDEWSFRQVKFGKDKHQILRLIDKYKAEGSRESE